MTNRRLFKTRGKGLLFCCEERVGHPRGTPVFMYKIPITPGKRKRTV